MKLSLKFTLFFALGLIVFILYLGIVMVILFDVLLPFIGIQGDDNLGAFLSVLALSFISGGLLFSKFFVRPLVYILSITEKLANGDYEIFDMKQILYNRKGNLKTRYMLYSEAINNLENLSAALKSAKEEREKLERAKKNWISSVSHDLKTPLSYIVGYSALLSNKEYSFDQEEQEQYLVQIYTKGKYMEELITDLNLSFKLADSDLSLNLSMTNVNLVRFVQEIAADVANIPEANEYHFKFEAEKKEIWINGDRKMLYRALQNIMLNAIKHNPEGTHVDVRIESENDHTVMVQISDDGIGLSKEAGLSVFDRYTSSSKESGLGLSIAKEIIKAHGGNIFVESTENVGSCFYISLPVMAC